MVKMVVAVEVSNLFSSGMKVCTKDMSLLLDVCTS